MHKARGQRQWVGGVSEASRFGTSANHRLLPLEGDLKLKPGQWLMWTLFYFSPVRLGRTRTS